MRAVGVGLLVFLLALACSARLLQPSGREARGPSAASSDSTSDAHAPRSYLQPNATRPDGTPIYVHVTQADMPWRVSVGDPPIAPRHASRKEGREAAIAAMRMWEEAIRVHVPWFRLEFTREDPTAAVRVHWKRRLTGKAAGRGNIEYEWVNGELRVGGELMMSTQPDPYLPRLTVEEVRRIVAHEFGHVLGLLHCLECDSAMNYAWHTRERVVVTETDIRTFLELLERPNGSPAR